MRVTIDDNRVELDPTTVMIGGEAEVYKLPPDKAVKIYKNKDHPDFANNKLQREMAEKRISEHQLKIPELIKKTGIDSNIIRPLQVATNRKSIIGYVMEFKKNCFTMFDLTNISFKKGIIDNNTVNDIFTELYELVANLHDNNIQIGDFNDNNVLISNDDFKTYLIDCDSYQFGNYNCYLFTNTYSDPRLCTYDNNEYMLVKKYDDLSDWYSFNTMLFKSFLYISPYGGIYKNKNIKQSQRPIEHISIFNSGVKKPANMENIDILSDELLHHFYEIFEEGKRKVFDKNLLSQKWSVCSSCNTEHQKNSCPICGQKPVGLIKTTIVSNGSIKCETVFKTTGKILRYKVINGDLIYLYNENNCIYRENHVKVVDGNPTTMTKFKISKSRNIIGADNRVVEIGTGLNIITDKSGNYPCFNLDDYGNLYWSQGGYLQREDRSNIGNNINIGSVLQNNTMFWIDKTFGAGICRTGSYNYIFTFYGPTQGLKEVKIDKIIGKIVDINCVFSNDLCWMFIKTNNTDLYIFDKLGKILFHNIYKQGETEWTDSLYNKTALNNMLFSSTDNGIIRIDFENNSVNKTREYPDSSKWVDNDTLLSIYGNNIYICNEKEIKKLTM